MSVKKPSIRPVQSVVDIKTIGHTSTLFDDLYHRVLRAPWSLFFLALIVMFLGINVIFAAIYRTHPGDVSSVNDFEDAFYFSVQTLATIGYGTMAPQTRFAHLVVVAEALTGTLSVALVTGATFAKFARPTARVLFSKAVVVYPRDGVPHLMFRMANWRQNAVVEAQVRATLLINEITQEGERMRRPHDILLVRDKSPVFQLSFTVMHRIDEHSPFFGPDALQRLRGLEAEMFLSLVGMDATMGQTIHARYRYDLKDIVWGERFADVFSLGKDGKRVLDYTHFHETTKG